MTRKKKSPARTWQHFDRDELVKVSTGGQVLFEGRVDDKTEDGKIVWILPLNGHRRLIHIEDDVNLAKFNA